MTKQQHENAGARFIVSLVVRINLALFSGARFDHGTAGALPRVILLT
ncbi:MAG: hypothetical protein ABJL67_18840 [Sulfitobacter sp.]